MSEPYKHVRPGANPLTGFPKHVLELLDRLHGESKKQEESMDFTNFGALTDEEKSTYVRDKFVALDKDKAQYVYALARALDARNIVEAGTSFGVSTIYLAYAASQNAAVGGKPARVIATEHEPTKAAKAREYWKQCGDITDVIDLREGDLRETLKTGVDQVDFLLLDSKYLEPNELEQAVNAVPVWTPMVMPTIKLVQPKLRRGAVIVTDNTLTSKGYDEYIEYVRNKDNGFVNITVPYTNGLEMSIYLP
ncbi:hypothetical protein QQS21_011608 [Conoideocrella luteorostrata]|uniref:O-methyltransferase n=1 Tax=Conoideocrella luteorostrata TaxID=1105319 RepID=A0AAJ0FT78_9HYPO|nr:hypothetical protein QQS21_011608 [Conoideocrella luteorostrata]